MTLCVKILLPHGHIWTFGEVDCFVDSILKKAEPLPRLDPMQIANETARATFVSVVPVVKAELNYTSDAGVWQKRLWKSVAAELANGQVTVKLPAERPLVCCLSVTDQRGLVVSTPHEEFPAADGK